jgi:hypothetical protein
MVLKRPPLTPDPSPRRGEGRKLVRHLKQSFKINAPAYLIGGGFEKLLPASRFRSRHQAEMSLRHLETGQTRQPA